MRWEHPHKFWILWLLLLFLLRLPSFTQDFMDSDEGIYGAVGLTISHGGQPYRDAVERKTPLVYYAYAGLFTLFGDGNMRAVHIAMAIWIGLTSLALFAFVRRLYGDRHPQLPHYAALAYVVLGAGYHFEFQAANCEMWLDLPLTLGFLLLLQPLRFKTPLTAPNRLMTATATLASGVLFGIAFLCKQTALPPFAAALGCLVICGFLQKRWTATPALALLLAIGFAVPTAILYVIYRQLGLDHDALYWAWTINFTYVADSFDLSYVLKIAARQIGVFVLATAPFMLLAVGCLMHLGRAGRRGLPLLAWLLGSIGAMSVSGKFYSHYFFHLVAPVSIMAALTFSQLQPSAKRRFTWAIGVLALLATTLWFYRLDLLRWYGHGYTEPDYRSIAAYIEKHSQPDERIFVWGYSPEIYVLAKRSTAARFVFCDYLTGRISSHPRVLDPSFDTLPYAAPGAWLLFQLDMEKNRPRYIVDAAVGNFHQYRKYSPHNYPWLHGLLKRDYVLETNIAGADLYRRRTQ